MKIKPKSSTLELQALDELALLAHNRKLKRYPNMPQAYIPRAKYESMTANGLTRCVLLWLDLNNQYCVRVNTTGRKLPDTKIVDVVGRTHTFQGKWIPGTTKRGTADVHASINGRHISIEIKVGADRQSGHQHETQQQVESSKGVYLVVRSFHQFLTWYKGFTGEPETLMIKNFCKR